MAIHGTQWAVTDRLTFIEVTPIRDIKQHFLGDECWCGPVVDTIPGGLPDLMITHNAADERELTEKVEAA